MTPSGQTVCLCMIVKDEAPVIRRCLDSVRPLIDHWVIVDTGSTDGTQAIVREHLRDVPGELVERPWRDFAHNRSEALALARPHGTYSLIIDADDTMVVPEGFRLPDLDADSYAVDIDFGAIRYSRPQFVRADLGWRYEGVIHEYLACENAKTSGHLPLILQIHQDGARRRDPETYKKDAAVLERAVTEETDPFKLARYTFYLAQSYRDSGQGEKALPLYLQRAEMGFWDQEVYCSLLYAGRLSEAAKRDPSEILALYFKASATCPLRAEAAHEAARFQRNRGEFRQGYEIAKAAIDLPRFVGGLFVESWIYEYGILDEYAINAFWAGHHIDCLLACAILLARPNLDDVTKDRVVANRNFAFDRLKAANSLWLETLSDDRWPRMAVVTPYFQESAETLRRCIDSVKLQTMKTDHIVVADGHPQNWLDGEVTRHIRLDRPSADYGNTPRTIGGLLAASNGYTAICLLDADCWFDSDHIESCLVAALTKGMDACRSVTASRKFWRPDMTLMPLKEPEPERFVDTNCYFLLPPTFGILATWSLIPKRLDWIGDRVFHLVAETGGNLTASTRHETVNYLTVYEVSFRAIGEKPPVNAKGLPDHAAYRAWIDALPSEALEVLRRQLGADIRGLYHANHRGGASVVEVPIAVGPRGAPTSLNLRSEPRQLHRRSINTQILESNVVIGAAVGYDNSKVHNFLHSLSNIKFDGKIILLVESGREAFEKFDLDLSPIYIDPNPKAEAQRNPSIRRYFWIKDVLEHIHCKQRILLTDVRDVAFQSDPFVSHYVGRTSLLFALEERSIGSCQHNTKWIAQMYGAGVLDSIDGYVISCSGTTIGTHNHIYAYIRKMCRHLQTAPDIVGIDQGVHNYILYKEAIEGQRLGLNGSSYVATIQYMNRLDIVDGIAMNYDGGKIPLLHQYDRLDREVQRQIAAIDVPVG